MIDVRTPASRATDPETSALAEQHVTTIGRRATNQGIAARAVAAWPGRTSRELAELARMDRHEMARRLPECTTAGAAFQGYITHRSGRPAVTWWPTREAAEESKR